MAHETDIDVNEIIERSSGRSGNVFEYQPGDSFVHRLNPVTKLVISVSLVFIAFLFPTYPGPAVLTVATFVVVVLAGVTKAVLRIVAVIGTPLAASLLIIHGLFYPGNETVLYTVGGVPVVEQVHYYREGFEFALLYLFRILTLMLALLVTIVTTHPKRLTIALMEKGMPSKFAYVFLAALQLIPQLQARAVSILDAQRARGLDTKATLRRRVRSLFALMIPLLIGTLIATETRALALESRGFSRVGERTFLLDVPDTALDRALRWLAVAAVVVVAVWRVVFG
ncbi:energy-coupling factor transporter transmembrane protein EcfT [Natronococcus pandeyae]|uniref:Energy-coupling factor transporter transmembrane protein EcfT n=1 Tax=Natronococcus pandeyae TaxID=2055836 RepID=A0A8J8Q2P3_9EURY|nr:energy-coupling factor transporter transmembrane component T [Natronococcus pandeyae]TYL39311.1 energy-coupling factor transporter transmembrane protein EcfT [Natronococcus pandeyae]